MTFNKFTFLIFSFSLISCASTTSTRKWASANQKQAALLIEATPSPSPAPVSPSLLPHAIIYSPHSEGDVEKLLGILETNPNFRLTLVFPPKYFDQADRKLTFDRFRLLHSSKQIEIGLTLDNEPVLPLLANLKAAGEKVSKWSISFEWLEDAAYQVARGSAKYQKRWGQLPSGFLPPHFALSEEVVNALKRFRLNWVIGKSNADWGVKFFGGLALLVPAEISLDESIPEGTRAWAKNLANEAFRYPFFYIDASQWADPNSESTFLNEVIAFSQNQSNNPFITSSEFVETLGDEYELPKNKDIFAYDYFSWVTTPLQKKAWTALSEARETIETYKNSGRAQLQRLDAATEEMAIAQSGLFLRSIGETQTSNPSVERNFVATLSNIYRLCNTPIPSYLNSLFSNRSFQKAVSKPTENDRPFFVEGGQSLTWNDPAGDDNGSGSYTYPSGRYPKGAFDLRDLSITWTDIEITFSASVVNMPSLNTSFALPLLDIYIDINKLSGAGSSAPLRRRATSLIDKNAAWEYAVCMSPNSAHLLQAIPGGDARFLTKVKSETHSNSFSATFSRSQLRGDPNQWRLTAGLMGGENNKRGDDLIPLTVGSNSTERSFGGAVAGRIAPPYLDLLTASSEDQKTLLSGYESGAKIVLPFVEGQ